MSDVRIINADVLDGLAQIADESVQCVITSPPYFGLRDYGTASWEGGNADCDHRASGERKQIPHGDGRARDSYADERHLIAGAGANYKDVCGKCGAKRVDKQIGLESTPQEYVNRLVGVFREVRRVLRDDGCVFLNLGDSYFSSGVGRQPSVRRATAYGTSGKAPASSQSRDCLCESLCDECLRAYRIGKSHSGSPLAPMLTALPSVSSHAHTGSPNARLPTSRSSQAAGRSVDAIQDQPLAQCRVAEQHHASQASTPDLSSPQRQAGSRPSDTPSVCRLCSRSFLRVSLACECKTAGPFASRSAPCAAQVLTEEEDSTLGIAEIGGSSSDRTLGKASDLAYLDFTTDCHHLKAKDLVGIPWRVALALQADGWYLRSDIIWHKPNAMPESITDRPTKSHEYMFMMTKNSSYFYDHESARESSVCKPGTAGTWNGNRDSGLPGGATRFARPNLGGSIDGARNLRSVWSISTEPTTFAHFATFPSALVERCVLAGSRRGDTVLDPFAGSGTTLMVARNLGRNAIGIEINPEYVKIIEQRCMLPWERTPQKDAEQPTLFTDGGMVESAGSLSK